MYKDFIIFMLGVLTSFMLIIIFGEIHDRYGNTPSNKEKRKYIEDRMKDVHDALKIASSEVIITGHYSIIDNYYDYVKLQLEWLNSEDVMRHGNVEDVMRLRRSCLDLLASNRNRSLRSVVLEDIDDITWETNRLSSTYDYKIKFYTKAYKIYISWLNSNDLLCESNSERELYKAKLEKAILHLQNIR
ncbi:hypothetical protein JDFnp1_68 [Fusobacterium phage JD-Fnp1]|nr:hypothetical protein JDFnp1_68 [Fusobacterium phage JD-Fnp1]